MTRLRWRSLTDAQREREYSPSSCLPDGDYRPFVAAYRSESDSAWATVEAAAGVRTTTVAYGDAAPNTLDVAVPVAADPPPLLVYFHGGYWQELSKRESRFAAVHCVDRGWAFAAVDYTLAPDADLDQIVRECHQAVRTVGESGSSLGIDPHRIAVVLGTGIGGLATMHSQHTQLSQGGPERVNPLTVPMLIPDAAAGQVAIDLGLKGGAHTPVSACALSLIHI